MDWSFPNWFAWLQTDVSLQYLVPGMLVIVAAYHGVVALQTRQRPLFWLGVYALAMAGFLALPQHQEPVAITFTFPWLRIAAALLVVTAGSALTVQVLQREKRRLWWPRLLYGGCAIAAIVCIGIPIASLAGYGRLADSAVPVPLVLFTIVGLNAWAALSTTEVNGRRGWLFYALGWGTALFALPAVWLASPGQVGEVLAEGLILGHVLLLAFALAERTNRLQEQLQHLADLEVQYRELFGRVGHLTRTHVHAALGTAELLRVAPRREYLGVMERCVQSLLRDMSITEANAALARGEQFLDAVDVPLRQWINQVLAHGSALARELRVMLYSTVDPALPEQIRTDARHLQCALSVALEQGMRYCAGGVVRLHVEGLPEDATRVRFVLMAAQTTAVAAGWRDPGLQDWLQRMAVALGGVSGLNVRGNRLELWLELPVLHGASARESAQQLELEPGRILLIDAEEPFRSAVAALLHARGCTVETAPGIEEFLARRAASRGGLPGAAAEQEWLWNHPTARTHGPSDAEQDEGSAERHPDHYDRLIIAVATPDEDNSPALLDRLGQQGVEAETSIVLLPSWQWIRETRPSTTTFRLHRPLSAEELLDDLLLIDNRHDAFKQGLRVVLGVADEDLGAAITGLLRSLGCKVSRADSGRLLLHRYTRGRHGLIPACELVVLEDTEEGVETARQIRAFEAQRGPQRVCIAVLTRPLEGRDSWQQSDFDIAVPLPPTAARLRTVVYHASHGAGGESGSEG